MTGEEQGLTGFCGVDRAGCVGEPASDDRRVRRPSVSGVVGAVSAVGVEGIWVFSVGSDGTLAVEARVTTGTSASVRVGNC